MPAEVVVVSFNGAAPGTPHEVTSDRYNCSDATDPNLQYANQVPGTGLTNYSWWKHRGLYVKSGSFSQLSEWRYGGPGNSKSAWGLGSKGGMIQIAVKDSPTVAGCPLANYQQATGTSTSGDDIHTAHLYYKDETAPCVDFDSLDEDNPLVFDDQVITASGNYTKLIVSQLVLKDDTTFGEKTIIYEWYKWKEI